MFQPQVGTGDQNRFTLQERELLKNTFKDNPDLWVVMRKLFYPAIDPTAPIGKVLDFWMIEAAETKNLPLDQVHVNLLARNKQIGFIEAQLRELWAIINQKEETPEEQKARFKKDSMK